MFGNNDGFFSSQSPCTASFSFDRDGSAVKGIELNRYDKSKKEKRAVETSIWRAKINGEQFDRLAKNVIGSEIFKNWNDQLSINVSNTKITVEHRNGARILMSNVDKTTTGFLPLIDSFKRSESELDWQKQQ